MQKQARNGVVGIRHKFFYNVGGGINGASEFLMAGYSRPSPCGPPQTALKIARAIFYVYHVLSRGSAETGRAILSSLQEHYLVITAVGADRPGIVNAITRHVSSCGCNIEDSRLAMFGEEFTFIMLLSGSWNAIAQIESTLPLKGAEMDLLIVMKRTESQARPPMPSTVWVKVDVADSPHIIERFTNLFDSHQMNIAELASKTQPAKGDQPQQLYIQITAHSPALLDGSIIEPAFYQLCTELHAQGSISVVNYPQHEEKDGE